MGDFIPPTDGKVTKKASATAFVPPTDSVELKKKEELDPTSTPQKSVSGTPTGSSGGVNPAFKSSIPSPIPNFNSMESVKSVVQKPQVKLQKPPEKEETSFFDYLKENLDTGLATVSKSVYDAPGLIYDAAAAITNIPFKLAGVPENELASSDKLAKDLGFRNIPSEILKEKIKVSNEKINEYASKNGGDALAALENGNYSGAAKLVAGTTMQSLPIMVAAMASGGQSTALTAIGVSTASTKNAQLKEENPEMELGTRVLNSANAGVIEAVTGHLFTGASGAVMKKILAEKGVEAGSKIIGKSFRSTIEKSIEKNPLVGAIGEVVEESAVEFGNQVNDMSSGIRTEFDFHAIKNAGLSATGMGGLQTLGVYGAKGYVKAKDYAKLKSTNKEVFKLRNEIDNGNLSPENKAILSLRADRLEAENKKLLGTEIEKAKALPTESKTELNALNAEFEDLKLKFDDIDEADDIPDNLKPALKEEIRLQASKNQKRKTEILSQNDGLEVKDDFSKFEGVEPDFDLENGKISSLPLKEQNRLNKLAVEQITGGDKTIEYTKEQVSQTANEIYKNEQTPPAAEAQPQAEVPQQAEAEKVVEQAVINNDEIATKNNNKVNDVNALSNGSNQEVSPVEDVVATSSNEPIVYKVTALLPKKFNANSNNTLMTESELELLDAKAEKIIENPREDVSDRVRIQQGNAFTIQDLDAIEQFFKARREGIETRSFSDWRKNTTLEKNEATPETNTPTNGNVQLGASNVGESGNSKQESPVQESVSSSVDGGEVKGDASVGENNNSWDKEFQRAKSENDLKALDVLYDKVKVMLNGIAQKKGEETVRYFQNLKNEIKNYSVELKKTVETLQPKSKGDVEVGKIKPNIGDKVDFGEGEEVITGFAEIQGQTFIKSKPIEGNMVNRESLNPLSEYNDVLSKQEEYFKRAEENKKAQKEREIEAENKAKKQQEKQNEFEDIDGFANDKTAIQKGKILQHLNKQVYRGTIKSELRRIANLPHRFIERDGKKRVIYTEENGTEFLLSDVYTTKTGLEYLQYLVDKNAKTVETAQVENKQKPTTKERIAERIKLSDAKVDDWKNAVKDIDSIFGIKIKVDDIEGLNKNGIDIVEVIANIAKQAIAAGIHIDEAINKTIEHFKGKYDFDVNIDEIKERINPKKEAEKNSKDLLSKMTDVPNSGEIGKYISRENIEESDSEEEFATNQDYDKLKLVDSLLYGKSIVEEAKANFGDNYIEELIKNINAIKNVDSKTLHIISLENDLRQRRKESTDIQEKEFLTEQINRLQPISQKLANTVSRALNLNKLRQLSESGVNPNDKSNSIYTKEELETKHEIGKSFGKDINDIQEQYEEIFQDETDAVETTPDNEENILKYSQEDFDRELQKAKDELGNDYNISVFENLKRQAKKDKLSDKKEDLKAAKAKVLEDIRKVVKESMGQMSVNPLAKPLEFAALVTKLAKLHIQDGALSLEEVANNIYNDLKDMSKDISKESIFNILKSKPKKVMSEATKRKIYITLLNKNIESLDTQIEAKKRDVINRVDKYKNDAEIKDLRDKRTEKRDELAKVDPSYAESRKLATDLKTAQKSLDEYQRRIDENELSPKENQPKVVAEKLKKLRERRDAKRKEFLAKKKKYDDSLKPVAVPPTKEELAEKKYLSDVNNKINSLTKRIEDLKAKKPKTNDGKSTVWNAKISELENELGKLKEKTKGGKETAKEKQNLTEEEIFQKKIDQKIRQAEKALQDHKAKKPKFVVGANSVWSEELSAIKTELSNLRNENSDAKKKAREIKNKAVELLINSGYGKEITVTKKEVDADGNITKVKSTKKILDWKKLAGESGSVVNISKAIEKVLADQNLSKNEISEMVTEMKTAIEEIKTSITEKSLTDLQNKNKISKTVNVSTEAKKLSQLYNQGMFDDNMDKYDIALNRILGFDKFKEKQYQDLKDYSRLLAGLFANKNIYNDGELISEDVLRTQIAHINKQINEIVNKAAMGKGITPRKIVSIIRDYSDMALLSKLLSLKQAIENPWSGFTERKYQQIGSMFDGIKLTPELKKQISKAGISVFNDIRVSGSPDLGDSSFSSIQSRKIDDKIRGIKLKGRAGRVKNGVASFISGTAYLNAADSYNKVKILETVFAKAMIDILSNKNYGRNNIMSVKEATTFVSEALTGEGFKEALVKAEKFIKETNQEAGKEILPYTDDNIYRFAMDLVKDNLSATGVIESEMVKAIFAGSFKAAGSALGHEQNNAVSELYKSTSQIIDRKIRDAIKKKDYVSFTKYVTLNIIKNITLPFVSGRFNWVVLSAQKSGANLGLSMLVTANKKSKNKIDFSTEEGIKNLSEAVHWKLRHDMTVKRSVTGLALNVLAIAALAATGGDDELEKLLEKSPTGKKLFKWLGPPLLNLYFASQKGVQESLDFILDFYSVTGNEDRGSIIAQFKILLDDNATEKQTNKAKGAVGKAVGKAFDTPVPWRLGKDFYNVSNEIIGKEQYTANYNATSYLSGLFQGGFFETIGMREILSFGHVEEKYVSKEIRDTPEYKFDKKQKEIKEYNALPEVEQNKVDSNAKIPSLRGAITEQENMKYAIKTKTPYYVKGDSEPIDLSDITIAEIDETIADLKNSIEEMKKEAGDKYTEPKN